MPEINNDKNVYLLGAGFSKEIGLPLQDDFLLVAKEVFFKNPTSFDHFKKVFDYQNRLTRMKHYLNYPLLNLEHLFNLIEMDYFYSKSEELKIIKNDFTKLICDVLKDITPRPISTDNADKCISEIKYNNYVSFIKLLISDDKYNLNLYDDTIISFNYDLVLEGAAIIYNWKRHKDQDHSRRGRDNFITLNTLFDKSNIDNDDISKYFNNYDNLSYFPNLPLFDKGKNSIRYIKLHGSINWKTTDGNTFIVPPTWNKSDTEVRKLWYLAYEELKKAKRIIIIGYSFPETDIYIKSLLGLALNENDILQHIFFINPDKDLAKKLSLSLLDKYFEKYCSYKEWKFSEIISGTEAREFIRGSLNRK